MRALAALAPGYVYADAGQAGKVARAVALAGGNPRSFGGLDLIAIIQKSYDPATGRYHPMLLYRHTLAVEGLVRAGETPPPAALQALLNAQLADGGWFWSFDAEQSDVDSTGRVLQVLAGQAGVRAQFKPEAAFGRAAAFLCRQQLSTGGWNVGNQDGPANANSTALAVAGLRAAGYDPQARAFGRAGHGAVDALRTYQEPAGGFVYVRAPGKEESRLMATIDALSALAQPLAQAAPRGRSCVSDSQSLAGAPERLGLLPDPLILDHLLSEHLYFIFREEQSMLRRLLFVAVLALALSVALVGVVAAVDTGTKQVGVVIAFPDGAAHTEIVTVPITATAFDVLKAAKINLVSQTSSFGPAVCSINNVGCPATNCFCDPKQFWAYYHLNGNAWVVSAEGASGHVPANGAVEGFVWSGMDAKFNPTSQPPTAITISTRWG